MTRYKQVQNLIKNSKKKLTSIEDLYNKSLKGKDIDPDLQIEIKNLLENLRSCLDYVARDIASDVLSLSDESKVYFPIVSPDKDKSSFEGAISRNLPRLEVKNIAIFNLLESYQPYKEGYDWLGKFADITSKLKHMELIPQKKTEQTRISSENNTSSSKVSWDPNSVKFGNGVYINQAYVNPTTQLPVRHPNNVVRKEIWVSFLFDGHDVSVLPFLKQCLNGVEKITETLYKSLDN
ncbi:hypothetical protein GF362_00335 [Candidatus Dojkabacteria bacterium]|nr:hypothetical protein [Candidatus Dojkabacteria bacterium]